MAETSAGADADEMNASATDNATVFASDGAAQYNPGDQKIRVDDHGEGAIKVGDFIVIGKTGTITGPVDLDTLSVWHREIRRVEHIDTDATGTKGWFHLDRPLAYTHHRNSAPASGTTTACPIARVTTMTEVSANKHIKFVPGVYDTVDTPDPVMSIEPRYFLGTAANRNFTSVYAGQRTFAGALNGIILLNGWPLRWGIGREIPIPRTTAVFSFDTLGTASFVGDTFIKFAGTVDSALSVGDYVIFEYNTAGYSLGTAADHTVEINQVKTVYAASTQNQWVEFEHPMKYAHASGTDARLVTPSGGITHYIIENNDLPSLSMHLSMKDSNNIAANQQQFDRRWLGGKVGAMSIIAEEGGLLSVSWDSLIFKDMIHDQSRQVGTDRYLATQAVVTTTQASAVPDMPGYAIMNQYATADVTLPTTEPYYFSGGTITLNGTEFARVRSFTISINNNEDPRYYISSRYGDHKGPSEIREQRREYSIACTVALPDTQASEYATDMDAATSLFKELLLEGRYGATSGHEGFAISLKFVRGTFADSGAVIWEDAMWIHIPGIDQTSTQRLEGSDGSPAGTLFVPGDNISQSTSGAVNRGGAFLRTAPHTITSEAPFQVALDMVFRGMTIVVRDQEPYYP
jgi:hypothetical protein